MIALIQRVRRASVDVDGECIATIGTGILALIGVAAGDDTAQADRLLERVLTYRIFPDDEGRMNRDLRSTGGGLLLVPQFTLAADTRSGNRPGFSTAAEPALARELFDALLADARAVHPQVACGEFGAHMAVQGVNDGPVTFWLQVAPGGN
jgi:D-tyrosyl-tRNA(Tyr) deacylase